MKNVLIAAAFGLALPVAAQAATVTQLDPYGFAEFGAVGGTELGVGELRGGNAGPSGDWEVDARNQASAVGGTQSQYDWPTGDSSTAFRLSTSEANGGTMTMELLDANGGSLVADTTSIVLGDADAMYVRVRGRTEASLTGMMLGATNIGDLTSVNGDDAWLRIGDYAWGANWVLTGTINFVGLPSNGNGSNWAAQFKLVDEPAPIPLPAAGWMLLAGLGGLAALRRKQRG
jgi:opacity protein-like surface antigen